MSERAAVSAAAVLRVLALAWLWLSVGVSGCGERPPAIALTQARLVQSGAELGLRGDFGGHGAVVVLVDGVPAHSAVVEGQQLRVRVPALPRAGRVDVELVFADGARMQLPGALVVSAPDIDVQGR